MLSLRATVFLMLAGALFVAAAVAPARLPRENLLVYRGGSDEVAVKTKEAARSGEEMSARHAGARGDRSRQLCAAED